jgi:hypothetical protein
MAARRRRRRSRQSSVYSDAQIQQIDQMNAQNAPVKDIIKATGAKLSYINWRKYKDRRAGKRTVTRQSAGRGRQASNGRAATGGSMNRAVEAFAHVVQMGLDREEMAVLERLLKAMG